MKSIISPRFYYFITAPLLLVLSIYCFHVMQSTIIVFVFWLSCTTTVALGSFPLPLLAQRHSKHDVETTKIVLLIQNNSSICQTVWWRNADHSAACAPSWPTPISHFTWLWRQKHLTLPVAVRTARHPFNHCQKDQEEISKPEELWL